MNDAWLNIITHCLVDLTSRNVNVKFHNTDTVYLKSEKMHVDGYWDDSDPKQPVMEISCVGDAERWVPILVHEYGHYRQWVEKCAIWKVNQKLSADVLNMINTNEMVTKATLHHYTDSIRDLEADCERRTVRMLRKFKAPMDIKAYIREANAYIYFHNHLRVYRKWLPDDVNFSSIKGLLQACPATMQRDYKHTPEKLVKVFDRAFPRVKHNNVL